ncbi:MAG: hypothetical protein WD716_13305 [Fimbriimonadaceae bacterium]
MSTSHNDVLWLRPYGEIETHVPECGVNVLPGRIAALTHPLNKGRTIHLPDRELYDPDLCTVASSGVRGFDEGEVIVLAPDHGAYYPHISPDKRELRIVGVACPWWESVLAKYDEHGVHPAPGWMLVACSEVWKSGSPEGVLSTLDFRLTTATVVSSCGDDWTQPYKGERVCIQGMRTYTIRNESDNRTTTGRQSGDYRLAPPQLALVRAPIASKQWLQSLRKQI